MYVLYRVQHLYTVCTVSRAQGFHSTEVHWWLFIACDNALYGWELECVPYVKDQLRTIISNIYWQ